MIVPLAVIALMTQVPDPPPPPPPLEKVGRTSRAHFVFEWSGLSEDGQPATAVGVRFRLERINIDPPAPFAHGVLVDLEMSGEGTYRVPVARVFKGLAAGDWSITMRVMNGSGNFSEYTPSIEKELVIEAPETGTDFRIVKEGQKDGE